MRVTTSASSVNVVAGTHTRHEVDKVVNVTMRELKSLLQYCSDDAELFVTVIGNRQPLRLVSITTNNDSPAVVLFSDELPVVVPFSNELPPDDETGLVSSL